MEKILQLGTTTIMGLTILGLKSPAAQPLSQGVIEREKGVRQSHYQIERIVIGHDGHGMAKNATEKLKNGLFYSTLSDQFACLHIQVFTQ
jgi:hypothetical protein